MPSRSTRSRPFVQYSWKSTYPASFSGRPSASGWRLQYTIKPIIEWTGTPRPFTFRIKRSRKQGPVSWTLS
jgi:hypothetical protein